MGSQLFHSKHCHSGRKDRFYLGATSSKGEIPTKLDQQENSRDAPAGTASSKTP